MPNKTRQVRRHLKPWPPVGKPANGGPSSKKWRPPIRQWRPPIWLLFLCYCIGGGMVNLVASIPIPEVQWHSKTSARPVLINDLENSKRPLNKNFTIDSTRIPMIDTNSLVKVHSKTKQASFVTTISDANNGKKYSDKSDNNTKNAELNNDVDDKNYSKNPTKKSRQVPPPPPGTTEVPSFSRKVKVICFILSCCCVIAIVVNFINLHSDYEELQEFYIGYMGRKVLIQEQRLTSRTYLNLLRRAQKHGIEHEQFMEISEAFQSQMSSSSYNSRNNKHSPPIKRSPKCNGHVGASGTFHEIPENDLELNEIQHTGDISFIPLQERGLFIRDLKKPRRVRYGIIRMESPSSSPISVRRGCENDALDVPRQNGGQHSHQNHHHHRSTSNPRKNHPSTIMTSQSRQHCRDFVTSISPKDGCKHKTNLSVVVMQPPPTTIPSSNDFVRSDSSTEHGAEDWLLPLLAKEYIEDHDLEWRNLDYSADVGPPPTSFWVFMCQYDCHVFQSGMSERETQRTKDLLHQFRLWKLLKRKHWNVVVTERAKKEMADRDDSGL